jgi:LacI family transcriptional regulator
MLRQVTVALQNNLEKNRYLTLLIPITYDMTDDSIFNKVQALGAAAVCSIHFGREQLFERFEAASMPVVVIFNSQFQRNFHTVCADNFQGSYEAASHLIALGHKNIVYAEFDIYQLPSTLSDRYMGFLKAMFEFGIDFPSENKLHLDINDRADIKLQFEKIFPNSHIRPVPSAIFFIDDYLAAHCSGVLAELGLFSPNAISLIAAGEVLDYNEPYIPSITTMHTDPEQLGKFSAEMIVNLLGNSSMGNQVLKIKQTLIDRGSIQLEF